MKKQGKDVMYNMDIKRIYCVLLWLTLSAIICIPDTVESCSCFPAHAQTDYCNADYVIVARVLRKTTRSIKNNDAYKIEIKKAYKMSDKAQFFLKRGRILTSSSESMCGTALKVGKLYVIAGKDPTIGLCNYVKEYKNMTIVEKRGFAGAYKKGCACGINVCFHGDCSQYIGSCNWSPRAKCETNFSSCVPARGLFGKPGKPTKCHWSKTPLYKECLSDP